MGIYVKFYHDQIWSCHVMLAANFENYYFSPNSILNFRESYQIWGKLAQEQNSYRQKTKLVVENNPPPPPPHRAYRVNTWAGEYRSIKSELHICLKVSPLWFVITAPVPGNWTNCMLPEVSNSTQFDKVKGKHF